jgi:small nuclear ribonucleoprotein (snRNP)-like protein
VTGVLKGYDQLLNLVLDEVEEPVQGNKYMGSCYFVTFLFPVFCSYSQIQNRAYARSASLCFAGPQ